VLERGGEILRICCQAKQESVRAGSSGTATVMFFLKKINQKMNVVIVLLYRNIDSPINYGKVK
jgi:hypothetical protein